jgi:hypothetical protein
VERGTLDLTRVTSTADYLEAADHSAATEGLPARLEYGVTGLPEPEIVSGRFVVQRGPGFDPRTLDQEPGRETRRAQVRTYLFTRPFGKWQADNLSGHVAPLGKDVLPGPAPQALPAVPPGSFYARLFAQQLLPSGNTAAVEGSAGDAITREHAAAGLGMQRPFDAGNLGVEGDPESGHPVGIDGWAW